MSGSPTGRSSLAIGGFAAVLASSCCLGPLVLVALGFTGAWIGQLTALEAYRPWFIAAALVAMAVAYRQIFRPAPPCQPGVICTVPKVRSAYRLAFWIVIALIALAVVYPYVLPWFY